MSYPDHNSLANLYLLPVMRTLLKEKYNISARLELPMLLTGFSEGGGYTLRSSKLAQTSMAELLRDNKIRLVQTSHQEGAYSILDEINIILTNRMDGIFNCGAAPCSSQDMMLNSTSVTPYVDNLNIYKIANASLTASFSTTMASYIFTAIGTYTLHGDYSRMMSPAFWTNVATNAGHANTLELYSGNLASALSGSSISSSIASHTVASITAYATPSTPSITYYPLQYPLGSYGYSNSGALYLDSATINSPMFRAIWLESSTYDWRTKSPVNIFT